jgi:hypothetical protein
MALSLLLGFHSPSHTNSLLSPTRPAGAARAEGGTEKRNGINIQHCPNCDAAYSVPINCYHAICETHLGGCGTEFCFICAAYRSPILAHGNMMHRSSCPYNIDQYCCSRNCLKNHQKNCVEGKWNENCLECLKNEPGVMCSFPIESNPPDSGKHWKVLNLSDVEREAQMMQGAGTGTSGEKK